MQPRRKPRVARSFIVRCCLRSHRISSSTHRCGGSSIRGVASGRSRPMHGPEAGNPHSAARLDAHTSPAFRSGIAFRAILGPKTCARPDRPGASDERQAGQVGAGGAVPRFSALSGAKGLIHAGHLVTTAARTHSDSSSAQRPKRRLCQSRCPAHCQAPKSKTTRFAWPATQL